MPNTFPWLALFRQRHIEFVEQGPNVARGHINIRCPFCGPQDPSHHMGIQLTTGYWGCWRNDKHRGKKPERLLMSLLRCSWKEAHDLTTTDVTPRLELAELRRRMDPALHVRNAPRELVELVPDPAFFPIRSAGMGQRFYSYLLDRGFEHPLNVAKDYKLRGCLSGPFRQRIIFPFYIYGKLVGWTGRAIGRAAIRYKTHPADGTPDRVLFNFDPAYLNPTRTLAVCEGPIDALKLDYYGEGIRAVAILGLHLSDAKLGLLAVLAPAYEEIALVLDPDALARALELQGRLGALGKPVRILQLGEGDEDPGALSPREVRALLRGSRTGAL